MGIPPSFSCIATTRTREGGLIKIVKSKRKPYNEQLLEAKRRVALESLHNELHALKQAIGPTGVLVASAERYSRLSDGKYRNISELAMQVRELTESLRRLQP